VLLPQFMLPNPHDPPAEPAQRAVHEPIPGLVRRQFFTPERTVVDGQIGMPRTPMPETAIHEYRQPLASKNEVRLAEDGLMPPPESAKNSKINRRKRSQRSPEARNECDRKPRERERGKSGECLSRESERDSES